MYISSQLGPESAVQFKNNQIQNKYECYYKENEAYENIK